MSYIISTDSTADLPASYVKQHGVAVQFLSYAFGDTVYGNRNTVYPGVTRQLLHAWQLALPHPATGEVMKFSAPLPEDFRQIKELIEN